MSASDGRCKVMDASADGYGRGEACRALWLEPWWGSGTRSRSRSGDADRGEESGGIWPTALVLASAINSNSSSGSLTAPHGPSQVCRKDRGVGDKGKYCGRVKPCVSPSHCTVSLPLPLLPPPSPSPPLLQGALLRSCLLQSGLRPSDVIGLQMHSNGGYK